jgi:nanoRNase/pAp phosphatase (c-di-AMP/oligoRNAs hydrolase)
VKNLHRIRKFLSRNKHRISPMLILTHDYPDPDALASAFALQYLANKSFGIRSRIVYGGVIGRTENREMVRILRLPVYKLKASDLERYPHVALVDTQPRFGNNSFPEERKATIVIDQHSPVTKPAAELAVIDTSCGATSALLAQVLLSNRVDIPVRVATALVYGILSDTMNLFRVTSAEVVETYLTLLPLCDMRALAQIQNPSRSERFFRTLIKGLRRAMINRRLIVSHLGFVDSPDLVAQVADFLLTLEGMDSSLCTGRYKRNLHVSLRVADPKDGAGMILRDIFSDRAQAGGHGRIAGGKVIIGANVDEHLWEEEERSLTERLKKRLHIPKKSEFHSAFQKKGSRRKGY